MDYWDDTFTRLWYNAAGQLARISEDPPGTNTLDLQASITDFSYNPERRLAKVRDALANDATRVPTLTHVPVGDDNTVTLINYDTATGKVNHVTLPVPYDGTTGTQKPRPGHVYEYPAATRSRVRVDGLTGGTDEPKGFNREVTFDLAGRVATDESADADRG